MATRPENICPPEIVEIERRSETYSFLSAYLKYYNREEAVKYSNSTRIIEIQDQLAERCIELLNLEEDEEQLIFDIGCGSGLSGQTLSDHRHNWVGIDISRDMLDVAVDRESEGDLIEVDMGQGFNFRKGVFDSAISVSALQWLCVASKKSYNPMQRLKKFFLSLQNSLRIGGRAVLQFYPDGTDQIEMITTAAMRCGFTGGVIVDNPNSTKAKKLYLLISSGGNPKDKQILMVNGKNDDSDYDEDECNNDESKPARNSKYYPSLDINDANKRGKGKDREWATGKKEKQQRGGGAHGKDTKSDSKKSTRKQW